MAELIVVMGAYLAVSWLIAVLLAVALTAVRVGDSDALDVLVRKLGLEPDERD